MEVKKKQDDHDDNVDGNVDVLCRGKPGGQRR